MTDLVRDADADAVTVDQLRAALFDADRCREPVHAVVQAARDRAVAAVAVGASA